nr:SAM-dependent methyltransferase [Stenoxybacter acetivorans]
MRQEAAQQGSLPFSRFMALALYAPQYGYYSGGATQFGEGGDFVTAPTLTPLFGQTLAQQIAELLPQTDGIIYEFGAGGGQLAVQLLQTLPQDLVREYCIIELSAALAARQKQYIAENAPAAQSKIKHLNRLPENFNGIIIGNEVLDAMPVEVVRQTENGLSRMGAVWRDKAFDWQELPLDDTRLRQEANKYLPHGIFPYTTELHPQQQAFIKSLAEKLQRGAMIWIDYGFDAAQYYHPQRSKGTLMGHYRHHSIDNPFFYPGLMDLTAHVNFTAIAEAAIDSGLDLIGYTTQSHFLLNLGLTELLTQIGNPADFSYIHAAAACQTLTAPQEMGELFKVIAFGKNIDVDWRGFRAGDICHKL